MSLRRPSNLTYANVMATVAVFLALGGGAYAAFELPKGSVGSKQLKRGAVTPKKVAKATIKRFKGQKGDRGPQGLNGDRGLQGLKGDTGPTAGFAATGGSIPPSPGTTVYSAVFHLPVGGKLFVDATDNVSISCGAADCGEYYEIQVGGAPLPSNGIGFVDEAANSSKFEEVSLVGVTGQLSAGDHTVSLKRAHNYGSPAPTVTDFFEEQSISAVLLGA